MRSFNKKVIAQLGLAATLGLANYPVAAQTTIYSDDFSGDASVDLNGTTPDVASGEGGGALGAAWMASANFNADGVASNDLGLTGNSIGAGVALLPFVPQYGYRYTLSADMIGLTGSNNRWMAIGFTRNVEIAWAANPLAGVRQWNSGSPGPDSPAFDPVLWALSRTGSAASGSDQYFTGPGTLGAVTVTTKSADSLKIIIDTSGTNWVVTWLFTTPSGTVGYTNASVVPEWDIKYVGFNSVGGNLGDSIDNFLITAEVLIPGPVAPIIGDQPVGFTNYVGNAKSLSVSALGTRPMSYQWYKNEEPLEGSTNSSVAFPSLDPTNTGLYYVIMTNIAGSATSSVVSVRVFNEGETNTISSSISLIKLPATGTDAATGISATKHYLAALDFGSVLDPVSVNGVPFQQVTAAGRGLSPYFARPLFTGVDETFGGTWMLSGAFPAVSLGFIEATGAHTTSDGDFGILMNDLAAISIAGSNNTMTVMLGGLTPGNSYSLRKYYRKWTSATRPINVIFNGQGSNEVCFVDLDLGGAFVLNYDFVAVSNTVTMVCESAANLAPHLYALTLESTTPVPTSAPVIVLQPVGATNWAGTGGSYTLTAQAAGTPPISYQWFKDGAVGPASDTLTLYDYDAGTYQVVAGNAYGYATSEVAVVSFVTGSMDLSPTLSLVQLPAFGTDEASDIWPTNKYLAALDLSTPTSMDPLAINGVSFEQVILQGFGTGQNQNPVISGVDSTFGGTWEFSATNQSPASQGFLNRNQSNGQADGNMLALLDDFAYNHDPRLGDPTVLKLGGLTPGSGYSLRYYFRGYSLPHTGRVITFAFDGQGYDETCVVDIDQGGAYYLKYDFTAARMDVSMSAAGFVAAGSHFYAVTLQETTPAIVLNYSKNGGNITLSWDENLTGYILESSGEIPAVTWDPVDGVVNNSVTLSVSTGSQFFRLKTQ